MLELSGALVTIDAIGCQTEIAQTILDGGADYVLVSGGKVYKLDNQAEFKKYAGQAVKVTGVADEDSIRVESVEPAS